MVNDYMGAVVFEMG